MEAFSAIMKSSLLFVSLELILKFTAEIQMYSLLYTYTAFELPQINYEGFNGKKYQFMYGLAISTLVDPADVCNHHDLTC